MTMQVGLIGTNGIVLASDTKHSVSPFSDRGARDHYTATKIKIDPTEQIAIACAGDLPTAFKIAEHIMSEFTRMPAQEREYRICEIGRSIGGLAAECLIAFPDGSLYLFQFSNGTIQCFQIYGSVHAGDRFNPANFWTTRLYKRMPIKKLLRLAAVVIFEAGKLNPDAVRGLEIVHWDGTKYHRLSKEENRACEAKAKKWDEQIGKFILGYGKESL